MAIEFHDDDNVNEKSKNRVQKIILMNKFYQKYKDLFPVQPKPSYAFGSYGGSYNNPPLPKSLKSSPYVAQKQPLYKKQSQHRQLFRNYARNELLSGDSLWTGLRQKASQKSPINREMEESILPRLRGLDQQIERRLERFRTEKAEKVRDYVRGNSGKQEYDDLGMFRVGDKSYIERRGEQKVFRTSKRHATETNRQDISEILDRRRNDSSHQHMPRQFTKQTTTKKSAHMTANIPTTKDTPKHSRRSHNIFSHDFTYHVPQRKPSRLFDPISNKLRTQLYSDTQNPQNSQLSKEQLQESYMSEYQRSYSNKKIGVCGQGEEEREIVERESGMENGGGIKRKEYDSGRDKGDGEEQDSRRINVGLRWRQQRTVKKPLAHYYKHIGQPSESQRQYVLDKTLPQDKRCAKFKQNLQPRPSLHPQPHPSLPSPSALLTFSQHQPNQFAFINSRLSDIYNFQNYYHHTFINSYKQAIIRRLQNKRRLQQRRGRLREVIMKDGGM